MLPLNKAIEERSLLNEAIPKRSCLSEAIQKLSRNGKCVL